MKHLLILTGCLLYFQTAFSQVTPNKYVTSLKGKNYRLDLQILQGGHSVSVEGYDGDDLIVEAVDTVNVSGSQPRETAGLKDVTGLMNNKPPLKQVSMQPVNIWGGAKDTITGTVIKGIIWRGFPPNRNLFIRVPRSINFSLNFRPSSVGSKISVKNLSGEINILGSASFITVSHVLGPLVLRSSGTNGLGKITVSDLDWHNAQAKQKCRIYITCAQQDVDVSIPADLKANVTVGSTHGAFYTDLIPAAQTSKPVANHNFVWTINGGGTPIFITTTYGNVYLRKEK